MDKENNFLLSAGLYFVLSGILFTVMAYKSFRETERL
jgi:hypothetical protein